MKRVSLAELRSDRGVTQVALAERLGVGQSVISTTEHRNNPHVSTLAVYVAALGGTLVLEAIFGDERYEIAVDDTV